MPLSFLSRLTICFFLCLPLINCQTMDRAFFGDDAYQAGRDMRLSDVPDRTQVAGETVSEDLQARLEADRAEGQRIQEADRDQLIPPRISNPRMETSKLDDPKQSPKRHSESDDDLNGRFANLSDNQDIQIIGQMDGPTTPNKTAPDKTAMGQNDTSPALSNIEKPLFDIKRQRNADSRSIGRPEPAVRKSNGSIMVYNIDQALPGRMARGENRPSVSYFGLTAPNSRQRRLALGRQAATQATPSFPQMDSFRPTTTGTGQLPAGNGQPITYVLFGHGSATLDDVDRRIIDQLVTQSKQNDRVIGIIGHASARAQTNDIQRRRKLNLRMSGKRAISVFDYVTNAGVAADKIELGTHGDTLATFDQVDGEENARRVDLYLY